jgi:hypothetical protein
MAGAPTVGADAPLAWRPLEAFANLPRRFETSQESPLTRRFPIAIAVVIATNPACTALVQRNVEPGRVGREERVAYGLDEVEEVEVEMFETERTTLAIGTMLGAWLTILLLAGSTS